MRRPGYSSVVHQVIDRLFVYGTLRDGEAARSVIAHHIARLEPATATGELIAFADYPGLVDRGEAPVRGELVWLSDLTAALPLLDAYEGDDFQRILKKVRREDGSEDYAWCYVLADPRVAAAGTPVAHGDWVRWRAERSGQFTK